MGKVFPHANGFTRVWVNIDRDSVFLVINVSGPDLLSLVKVSQWPVPPEKLASLEQEIPAYLSSRMVFELNGIPLTAQKVSRWEGADEYQLLNPKTPNFFKTSAVKRGGRLDSIVSVQHRLEMLFSFPRPAEKIESIKFSSQFAAEFSVESLCDFRLYLLGRIFQHAYLSGQDEFYSSLPTDLNNIQYPDIDLAQKEKENPPPEGESAYRWLIQLGVFLTVVLLVVYFRRKKS